MAFLSLVPCQMAEQPSHLGVWEDILMGTIFGICPGVSHQVSYRGKGGFPGSEQGEHFGSGKRLLEPWWNSDKQWLCWHSLWAFSWSQQTWVELGKVKSRSKHRSDVMHHAGNAPSKKTEVLLIRLTKKSDLDSNGNTSFLYSSRKLGGNVRVLKIHKGHLGTLHVSLIT